jgi:anthranilate phosphoribosyltransferase
VERHEVRATQLGFKRAPTTRLAGGDAAENAKLVEDVLRGEPGARRDVVLLNAAAALLVAGRVERLEEGIDRAALAIDAGVGEELLGRLREERRAADAARAQAEAEAAAGSQAGSPA